MNNQEIIEPQIWGNFSVRDTTIAIEWLMENDEVRRAVESAKIIADLGSGIGFSTQGLGRLCPNAIEIHSVDFSFTRLDDEVQKALLGKSRHHSRLFHDFLDQFVLDGKSFDLILIKSAPEHQLNKKRGYHLLADATAMGGIVLEIGDTGLDQDAMEQRFRLAADEGNYSLYAMRAWLKNS